ILKDRLKEPAEILTGNEGLVHLAKLSGIDLVIVAVSGIIGLVPTLAALASGTPVALANKETIVAGGPLILEKVHKKGVPLIPVDSEHSAIFQCLEQENKEAVDKIILTASGGPFLTYTREQLERVTPEMALKHPRWQMGAKITIDSAGLINKGLEVIEAHWLFQVPYEKIEVVIHPQSVVHSMVQYGDGSVLAQLGCPDMRIPIQYALTYPERWYNKFPRLNFLETQELTFQRPDYQKFPGLALAYQAGKTGGSMTAVYNAANEVAVEMFLQGKINFTRIPEIIESVMTEHHPLKAFTLEEILTVDSWARTAARKVTEKY
ncbi:MAG: 1-deoxy-D-xylulose 5-phosphate reductoisomerase, partial [Peptococcaceae bacterium]|nr:1-deoxy-D-xylulose 5-phosphate reductoisomerase [Peptococcaceae bacterium]